MSQAENFLTVAFKHAKETETVALSVLVDGLTAFLDQFGEASLTGSDFTAVIQTGDGETKRTRLLEAAGYPDDPGGLLRRKFRLEQQRRGQTDREQQQW